MKHETALKAAQWWAEQLKVGGTDAKFDNDNAVLATMFGGILQANARSHNTSEKIEKFVNALTDALLNEDDYGYIHIGVDYDPDTMLSNACAISGVKRNAFPWKTNMIISGDVIRVACGYGEPYEEI